MNLVIVESPAKCKKIQGFLGKTLLLNQLGHFRDLKKALGIDIENNFTQHMILFLIKKMLLVN